MANTQTTVPKFVAANTLPASSLNITAGTGVPVFANTTTRDAAFGGSNKALAEGQLCYLESTNIVQYYDGAAWATVGPAASKIAQVISTFKTNTFATTSTSYVDVTGLSVTITPTLNTSTILVIANMFCGANSARTCAQLVRGSTAIGNNTVVTNAAYGFMADDTSRLAQRAFNALPITILDSPATTSATTYKLQILNDGAATSTVNKWELNTGFGGSSSITVMEVLA